MRGILRKSSKNSTELTGNDVRPSLEEGDKSLDARKRSTSLSMLVSPRMRREEKQKKKLDKQISDLSQDGTNAQIGITSELLSKYKNYILISQPLFSSHSGCCHSFQRRKENTSTKDFFSTLPSFADFILGRVHTLKYISTLQTSS